MSTMDDRLREIIRTEVRNAIRDELQPVLSALERLTSDAVARSTEQAVRGSHGSMSGRWLKTEEAAALMGLRRGTLENWRAMTPRRGPEFRRIGRAVRYDRSEIDRYMSRL